MKKLIFVLFCALLALACNKRNGGGSNTSYKVATDATWPPMEFLNEGKEVIGFDIDVIHAIAEAAGFTVEVRNTAWDGIFAGLDTNNYDLVISSVTITEERKQAMDFSEPYINAGQVVIVRKETGGIGGLDDFSPGAILGAQIGTTGAFAINEREGIDLKTYDELGLGIADLANGKIDGIVADTPIAAQYVLNSPEYIDVLKIAGEPFTEEFYGIAVQKGNQKLLDLINTGLESIQSSGELDQIKEKWLG